MVGAASGAGGWRMAIATALPRALHRLGVERDKLAPALGVRAAVAVFVPLVLGELAGNVSLGMLFALGGLLTVQADVGGPYRTRAAAMGATVLGGTLALLVGGWAGGLPWLAVPLTFLWSFACGLATVYGNTATIVSLIVNVAFVLALGLGAQQIAPTQLALGLLGGGAFVMLYSLVLWPVHPYRPIARSIAGAYRAVAGVLAARGLGARDTEPASSASPDTAARREAARQALDAARQALGTVRAGSRGPSTMDTRLLLLVQEGERALVAALALDRALRRAARTSALRSVRSELATATGAQARALQALAAAVERGGGPVDVTEAERAVGALAARRADLRRALTHHATDYHAAALVSDAIGAVEAVGRQVRAAAEQARALRGAPGPAWQPPRWRERAADLRRALATLRDQLSFESITFRHALRLGIAAAAGVLFYTLAGLPRGYWVTVAIVALLKPNVGITTQRVVQRVIATVVGASVAALLIAAVPSFPVLEALIVGLTVLCFAVKPAHYVLFVTLLTPLVIFLVDLGHPGDLSFAGVRILNTCVGAALALLATYLLWPRWERERLPAQLAAALRANADYFVALIGAYLDGARASAVPGARRRAEVANANAQASFQALLTELAAGDAVERLHGLVTYNQELYEAVAALEAHLPQYSGRHLLPGLDTFAQAAAATLRELAEAVEQRRTPAPAAALAASLQPIHARVRALEAARTAEIAHEPGGTPTREAVRDFTRLGVELDRIAGDVQSMHLALSAP